MVKYSLKIIIIAFIFAMAFPFIVVGQNSINDASAYFVSETGNDTNTGLSENAAFKTITHAIAISSKNSIKQINVIGTLSEAVTINNSGNQKIAISGITKNTKSVLTAPNVGTCTITISGNSNIIIENIDITHTEFFRAGSGIHLSDGAKLELGKDVVVRNNWGITKGGGIIVETGASLVLSSNCIVKENYAYYGGGIYVNGASLLMKDNSVITKNTAEDVKFGSSCYGGGILVIGKATCVLSGNSKVTENEVESAGGGIWVESGSSLKIQDAALVTKNVEFPDYNRHYITVESDVTYAEYIIDFLD